MIVLPKHQLFLPGKMSRTQSYLYMIVVPVIHASAHSQLHVQLPQRPSDRKKIRNPRKNSATMAKAKRKTGWRASEESGKNRSATERKAKEGIWAEKLARCTNAYAKRIVENAFSAETPVKWKGTRCTQTPAIKEKKVIYRSFNSAGVANVSA